MAGLELRTLPLFEDCREALLAVHGVATYDDGSKALGDQVVEELLVLR
jgi:hypothetical protein